MLIDLDLHMSSIVQKHSNVFFYISVYYILKVVLPWLPYAAFLAASKFSTKFVSLYFMKLIVRINVPLHLVANFVLWFRHQQITVKWDLSNFNCYSAINGPC